MDLRELLEPTLGAMGYELVDVETAHGGRLLRIFIDKPYGVTVDDCASVSNHLTKLFAVENIDYDRLEISSPGLDRSLKKAADFIRFSGQTVKIRLRVPIQGKRNFVGTLRELRDGILQLEVDGKELSTELSNLEKARLVPKFSFDRDDVDHKQG